MDGEDPKVPNPARRGFLDTAVNGTAAVVGVAALYPAARFLAPDPNVQAPSVVAGKVEEFERGGAKTILVADRPVLVLRGADGTFRAFLAICPHLACVVHFAKESGLIECGCHGGRFSLEGRNVAGPPPQPLEAMRVEVVDGNVVVSVI